MASGVRVGVYWFTVLVVILAAIQPLYVIADSRGGDGVYGFLVDYSGSGGFDSIVLTGDQVFLLGSFGSRGYEAVVASLRGLSEGSIVAAFKGKPFKQDIAYDVLVVGDRVYVMGRYNSMPAIIVVFGNGTLTARVFEKLPAGAFAREVVGGEVLSAIRLQNGDIAVLVAAKVKKAAGYNLYLVEMTPGLDRVVGVVRVYLSKAPSSTIYATARTGSLAVYCGDSFYHTYGYGNVLRVIRIPVSLLGGEGNPVANTIVVKEAPVIVTGITCSSSSVYVAGVIAEKAANHTGFIAVFDKESLELKDSVVLKLPETGSLLHDTPVYAITYSEGRLYIAGYLSGKPVLANYVAELDEALRPVRGVVVRGLGSTGSKILALAARGGELLAAGMALGWPPVPGKFRSGVTGGPVIVAMPWPLQGELRLVPEGAPDAKPATLAPMTVDGLDLLARALDNHGLLKTGATVYKAQKADPRNIVVAEEPVKPQSPEYRVLRLVEAKTPTTTTITMPKTTTGATTTTATGTTTSKPPLTTTPTSSPAPSTTSTTTATTSTNTGSPAAKPSKTTTTVPSQTGSETSASKPSGKPPSSAPTAKQGGGDNTLLVAGIAILVVIVAAIIVLARR